MYSPDMRASMTLRSQPSCALLASAAGYVWQRAPYRATAVAVGAAGPAARGPPQQNCTQSALLCGSGSVAAPTYHSARALVSMGMNSHARRAVVAAAGSGSWQEPSSQARAEEAAVEEEEEELDPAALHNDMRVEHTTGSECINRSASCLTPATPAPPTAALRLPPGRPPPIRLRRR